MDGCKKAVWFQLAIEWKLYPNTERCQKRKTRSHPTSALYVADVGYSCCLSFPPSFHSSIVLLSVFQSCLVSILFRWPFLLERKLCNSFFTYRNLLFSSSESSLKGFLRKFFFTQIRFVRKISVVLLHSWK